MSLMSKNTNVRDRRVCGLVVAPATVLAGILIGAASTGAVALYVLAALVLATSAAGYCPMYLLLRTGRPQPLAGVRSGPQLGLKH